MRISTLLNYALFSGYFYNELMPNSNHERNSADYICLKFEKQEAERRKKTEPIYGCKGKKVRPDETRRVFDFQIKEFNPYASRSSSD